MSKITFTKAPAPELPGKIKAQQDAGRVDIDLRADRHRRAVGRHRAEALGAAAARLRGQLPKLDDIYLPGALKMQGLAENQAVCIVFCPAGPLLEYMPDKVKKPPDTAQELLAWAKASTRTASSMRVRPIPGPGRTFLMGLPYILGDKDPMDPKDGWDKTWAYLKELGKYIEYYPTGTGATMKELGEGSRDIIASHHRLGHQSAHARRGAEGGEGRARSRASTGSPTRTTWRSRRASSDDKLAVLLDMTSYMLSKPAQATTYDKGYFYPGPGGEGRAAVDGAEGQPGRDQGVRPARIRQADRRGTVRGAAARGQAGLAFQRWDQQVGARVGK